MNQSISEMEPERSMRELLEAGAAVERRLLERERKAEQRLAAARAALTADEARLAKAARRLAKSREAVSTAEATLRERQTERAHGPTPAPELATAPSPE
jgi:hypothetical protein